LAKVLIKSNNLTQRDFTHGLKYIPFWHENLLFELIPKENKIGREISESEVLGAIKHLKSLNRVVNQRNVAEVIGCHFTINKGFVKAYKNLDNINK
jgi:hypothetical protein